LRYKSTPSIEEFQKNFARLLKENRFSEAEKALKVFQTQVGGRKDLEPLDFFRGINSVTESVRIL